jgi:hypothetical protein
MFDSSTLSVKTCVIRNLLADDFAGVFIAGSNRQVLFLASARRRSAHLYRALVFDFDTLRSEVIILSAQTALEVRE